MTIYFQKTTAYYAFQGWALPRVKSFDPGTLNYRQSNTLDVYDRLLIEQFSPNMMHCQL